MKVILLSRWFNLGLSVTIRKDAKSDFIKLLNSEDNSAFNSIMADVDYFRQGYEPIYITKYTAKRIASFFGTDDTNYFNQLVYANR